MHKTLTWVMILLVTGADGHALESDHRQSATLEAHQIEFDLKNGVRAYRGDVVFRQGSILLRCDELITHHNDDGELRKGVCNGTPARFQQRPEAADDDLIGSAQEITLDQTGNVVTLSGQVIVTQGRHTITGWLLTYDLATERISVNGGRSTVGHSADDPDDVHSVVPTSGSLGESGGANGASSRVRVVIQPSDR